MIREGMDGVALILISKEKADQFCCTSIAVQTCTNRFKIDLAAQIGDHKGHATIIFMDRVLVGNVPYIAAKILQIAKLNLGFAPGNDFNNVA